MDIVRLFKKYRHVLNAWKGGYITDWLKDNMLTEIFVESGYNSPLKFYMDYEEWLHKGYKQLDLFGEEN